MKELKLKGLKHSLETRTSLLHLNFKQPTLLSLPLVKRPHGKPKIRTDKNMHFWDISFEEDVALKLQECSQNLQPRLVFYSLSRHGLQFQNNFNFSSG